MKRKRLREYWKSTSRQKSAANFRQTHDPGGAGTGRTPLVVDHHHLARAFTREGRGRILVTVIGDLAGMVERDAFWGVMDNKRWVYPYRHKGERRHFKDIPKSITALKDDPFRSLAGELRRVGGYAKDTTPFSEFSAADFLAPPNVAQGRGGQFRQGHRESAGAGEKQGRGLPARLVRRRVGRLRISSAGRSARSRGGGFSRRLVLAAEHTMQPALEPAADDQKRERDGEGDDDNPPLPDPAGDADTGGKPGAGGAGQSVDLEMVLGAHNHAGAEKTDAGEDSLNDPAGFRSTFSLGRGLGRPVPRPLPWPGRRYQASSSRLACPGDRD